MKMSVRSWPSLGGGDSSSKDSVKPLPPDVVKCGTLKKYHTRYKTLKKKFFVLRGDSIEASARLEYYDTEKKFRSGQPAKRSITLKTCFNINKRSDMRHKLMIALYTKNDCFCIVLETETELDEWLKALLCLQQGEDIPDGVEARPNFEHVWEVDVQGKELGYVRNILGPYMLCLTDTDLTLVKKDDSQRYKILLRNIRCCGHLHSFVYLELGSAASIGPGNLWMLTEDSNIAQNVHAATLSAMTNCAKKDKDIIMPKSRNRSSSANEASRPIAVIQRWPTHAEGSLPGHKGESSVATSPASVTDSSHSVEVVDNVAGASGSMPASFANHRELHVTRYNLRRHSVSACGPGGGNHQRTYSFPLSPLPPSRRASTGTRPNITAPTPQKSATHSLTGVRDRCDSLPGRARTTSEGPHHHPAPRHLAPAHRPHSMYIRGISYSPPVGSSPVSPASGACSMTDSAGSSLSMDGDGEHWAVEGELRYGHSLTPEEPVIMEENMDDYAAWPPGTGEDEKLNNYVSMERSLCLPIHNNSSLTNLRKYSHNLTGVKQSSPSQGSFMDVYSPCGSSPLEASGAYMPMSPGDTRVLYNRQPQSANHSRGSSLAEEGYVPMAPGSQDAYVDMDHGSQSARKIGDVSSGSSCSLTSGTPSNDLRFSEYNLERVSSLISQDDGPSERPARAYSVGSRPVNINNTTTNRNEAVAQSEPQRVRAFSVGSTVPRARGVHPHLTTPTRQSSHSSVEPSEDLMELDFSKNKPRTRNKNIFKKPATSVSSERLTLPSSAVSSAASSYSTAEGSYMEMSPRSSPKPSDLDVDVTHLAPSPPKNNRFSSIIGRSPPKTSYPFERKIGFLSSSPPINPTSSPLYRVPEADSGYVDMTTGSRDDLNIEEPTFNNLSSSPCASSLSTASSVATVTYNPISDRSLIRQSSPLRNDEYLEMRPGGEAKPVLPKSSQPRVETFPVNETRPHQFIKVNPTPAIKQPLLTSQNLIRARGSLQEDYLDMSLKRKKSLIEDNNNTKIVAGRTEPVDTPKKAPEGYVEMSWSGNKSHRKPSLEGGKGEAENYMIMSGANCNKRDRRGSRKDRNRYSSQPIAIQTSNKEGQAASPFSGRKHSTGTPPKIPCYLPLNSFSSSSPSSSPYSSLGRTRGRKTARRDSKESMTSSGVTTPSGSTTTIFPLNLNSPGSPMKPFTAKQEYELSMCPVDASSGTVKLAQPQDTQTGAKPVMVDQSENEYVNFAPGSAGEVTSATVETAQVDGRKPSVERLVTDMSNLSLAGVEDTVNTRLSEPVVSEVSSEGVATTSKSNEPAIVSRTSSVSSVGEKEIQYASLDLVRSSSEDDSGQARSLKSQTSLTESSSTSTPSPNVAADKTFTYAEIDFAASQKLLRH